MEPNIKEVAARIRALREDLDLTLQEMADATGRSTAEYAAQESGEEDLSFTFLYKCADKFGVDVIELLTGENPHLTGYSLTRAADGLSIKRRAGFEYLHKAPHFRHKLAEPFLVTAPYLPEEQDVPGARLHHLRPHALRLRGPRRGARGGRLSHVRLRARPWHDRHRRRALRVPRGCPQAPRREDYLGAPAPGQAPRLDPRRAGERRTLPITSARRGA